MLCKIILLLENLCLFSVLLLWQLDYECLPPRSVLSTTITSFYFISHVCKTMGIVLPRSWFLVEKNVFPKRNFLSTQSCILNFWLTFLQWFSCSYGNILCVSNCLIIDVASVRMPSSFNEIWKSLWTCKEQLSLPGPCGMGWSLLTC